MTAPPTYNPMDLTGRHILVTGASAGIGRATALVLARLGARLTLNGRDQDRLDRTLAQLPGTEHATAAFDLAELDAVPAWVKGLAQSRGPFNGLAHCGGTQALRPVRSFRAGFFDDVQRTNLGSTLALARGFQQNGCTQKPAAMVFVSSTAGIKSAPGNIVYATSKAGVIAATKGLAIELLATGIRVNCVAPAIVETELIQRVRNALTPEQYEGLVKTQPLGIGDPVDVGHAVAYLLADTGRWITGTTLCVDGGATA